MGSVWYPGPQPPNPGGFESRQTAVGWVDAPGYLLPFANAYGYPPSSRDTSQVGA